MTQCRKSCAFHRGKDMGNTAYTFGKFLLVIFGCTYFLICFILGKEEEINNEKTPLQRSVLRNFKIYYLKISMEILLSDDGFSALSFDKRLTRRNQIAR